MYGQGGGGLPPPYCAQFLRGPNIEFLQRVGSNIVHKLGIKIAYSWRTLSFKVFGGSPILDSK